MSHHIDESNLNDYIMNIVKNPNNTCRRINGAFCEDFLKYKECKNGKNCHLYHLGVAEIIAFRQCYSSLYKVNKITKCHKENEHLLCTLLNCCEYHKYFENIYANKEHHKDMLNNSLHEYAFNYTKMKNEIRDLKRENNNMQNENYDLKSETKNLHEQISTLESTNFMIQIQATQDQKQISNDYKLQDEMSKNNNMLQNKIIEMDQIMQTMQSNLSYYQYHYHNYPHNIQSITPSSSGTIHFELPMQKVNEEDELHKKRKLV